MNIQIYLEVIIDYKSVFSKIIFTFHDLPSFLMHLNHFNHIFPYLNFRLKNLFQKSI